MNVSTDLAPILSERPIVLWVEDRLTKEYLTRLWEPTDRDFQILTGGGRNNIKSVVHDMRKENGFLHVFGYIDRDFESSNYNNWYISAADIAVFVSQSLEIENYLLDWDAMAGCNLNNNGRSAADIKSKAKVHAEKLKYWMACRRVLRDYRSNLIGAFPSHPNIEDINNQQEAEEYIKTQPPDNPWLGSLPSTTQNITDSGALTRDVSGSIASMESFLSSDFWETEFSGKEIYRNIRGYIYQGKRGTSSVELDIDFAKSIAAAQIEMKKIPQALCELEHAIKLKADFY